MVRDLVDEGVSNGFADLGSHHLTLVGLSVLALLLTGWIKCLKMRQPVMERKTLRWC